MHRHTWDRQTHCQTEKGTHRTDKTCIPPSLIKLNEMFYSIVLQWSCSTLLYCNEVNHTKTMLQSQNTSQDPQGWQLQEAAELKGIWHLSECYCYFSTCTQRARDNCGSNGAPNFACPCGSLVCSSPHFKQQLLASLWSFPHPNSWLHYVQPVLEPPPPHPPKVYCQQGLTAMRTVVFWQKTKKRLQSLIRQQSAAGTNTTVGFWQKAKKITVPKEATEVWHKYKRSSKCWNTNHIYI